MMEDGAVEVLAEEQKGPVDILDRLEDPAGPIGDLLVEAATEIRRLRVKLAAIRQLVDAQIVDG